MVHFVGAGPGAPDLITVRGKQYLEEADVIIYAGSLVNPQLLEYSKDVCTIHNRWISWMKKGSRMIPVLVSAHFVEQHPH